MSKIKERAQKIVVNRTAQNILIVITIVAFLFTFGFLAHIFHHPPQNNDMVNKPAPTYPAYNPPVVATSNKYAPIVLSGSGKSQLGGSDTERIHLAAGNYKIHAKCDGSSYYSLSLSNDAGRSVAGVAGELAPVDVVSAVTLSEGTYYFSYQADGNWEIVIQRI